MTFSNTTDKNGLIQLCEQLSNLGDGGISNNATLLKQFTNYLVMANNQAVSCILQVSKNHSYDDYNYSDIPDAPITLVAGQADYTLPTATVGANLATLLRVKGVYFLSGNERIYLPYMEQGDALSATSGLPSAYRLNGKSLFFNNPPNADTVSTYTSFHVEFERIQDQFTSTDTTQQPGFIEIYHPSLAIKASALYLLPVDRTLSLTYSSGDMLRPAMFENELWNLMRDWGNMAGDAPKTIKPKLTPYI